IILQLYPNNLLTLYALQTYIHPDAQTSTSNGLRAAICRPSIRILVLSDTDITLKCVEASMGEKQPLTKKLPATTT
ncbi:hypothetical protein S245_043638, partial [Arachis hypogaea]